MAQSEQQIKEPIEIPDFSVAQLREIAVNASKATSADIEILTAQLGRVPRGLVGIGARCVCGAPLVTITYPRLPDGSPFPTLFYLSHPWIVKEVSRIESAGEMATMNAELAADERLAAVHKSAHESYISRRNQLAEVPEIAGFSAGGMPDRVKCLHALAGYALSVGAGVTPFGDRVLEQIGWQPDICRCELEAK